MSAISFLPEIEPAQESIGPLLSAKTSKLNIRLPLCRAKKSVVSPLRAFVFSWLYSSRHPTPRHLYRADHRGDSRRYMSRRCGRN